MSQSVDPFAAERCTDCPAVYAVEPVPVLGPYIGVVGAVLCSLVGAFLLLAPYAFDYREGAASMPHSSVADLITGGGVLLLGLLTAALFGGTLARRLRVPEPEAYEAEPLQEAVGESAAAAETQSPATHGTATRYSAASAAAPASEPEARPAAPAASLADPGGALRDLLTPLVAALAADLRARESGETEGKRL